MDRKQVHNIHARVYGYMWIWTQANCGHERFHFLVSMYETYKLTSHLCVANLDLRETRDSKLYIRFRE